MNKLISACVVLLLFCCVLIIGPVGAARTIPALFTPACVSATALPEVDAPPATSPTGTGLFRQAKLTAVSSSERGEKPAYTLESSTPVLEGTANPHTEAFNRRAAAMVREMVGEFKAGLAELSDPPQTAGSFYDVTFSQLAPPGVILSIMFEVTGFFDGAAHPFHSTRTLNFNIESGRELSLDMLFRPDCDYLAVIADFCTTELAARDIGFEIGSTGGADPRPENYANWNLTPEGLLITFDEYQVAAYAEGAQQVLVSFRVLNNCLAADFPNLTH